MGVFDTIGAALTGNASPAQPPKGAAQPRARLTGLSDFDEAKAVRARQMAEQGLDPDGDPLPVSPAPALRGVSGVDAAMSAHADKVHPVKGR